MADSPSSDQPPIVQPSADTEVCAVSGKRYPRREMIQYEGRWIAAEHKDAFFQRMREGVAENKGMVYAGFWIRVVAKIIDGILLWVVGALVDLVFAIMILGKINWLNRGLQGADPHARLLYTVVTSLVGLVIGLLYACFFVRRFDATPGKMACGLKLLRSDGAKLSVGRIIGRLFSEWISAIILLIGYMMVGWDAQKRALHDRICDTWVIHAR